MTIAWAHACRGVLLGLAFAAGVAAAPAVAESQSSNSSSNCSDGRCTRVETRVIEDDRGAVRGWRRVEAWDERAAPWDAGDRWPSYRRGRDAADDD